MRVKLQNIASRIFAHKKILLAGGVLVLLFSFIPFSVAHASFWDGIINVVVGIVAKILELVAAILGELFKTLSTVLVDIIKYFLGMTVTPGIPTTPSFVTTSWNIVRNFVNLFFILILVFIGLATILRLPSYQYQKTLRLLIIMALLINFSGVFVGFIVDMSNLVAHFFLDKATGDWGKAAKPLISLSGDQSQKLATAISSIIYYFVAILIYFVLILIFAVRTMFLWTLTILAPLAFASYILPATKGRIWDEWWKTLVQWSIFAIPVTFFMFLANAALTGLSNIGAPRGSISTFVGFMAPFTALFILYLGVTTSQQMAPAAAKAVADWGKKAGMGIGKFAVKKPAGFVRDRITESPKGRTFLEYMDKLSTTPSKTWGEKKSWLNPVKWVQRSATTAISTATRFPGTAVNTFVTKADKAAFNEAKAKAAKNDFITNARAFREAPSNTAKAGVYAGMSKQQRKDLSDKDKVGESNIATEEEIRMVYIKANVLGEDEVVEAMERSLVNDKTMIDLLAGTKTEFMKTSERSTIKGLTKDEEKEGMRSFTDKIIADVKSADDVKQLGKGLDKNGDAVKAMHHFWGGPQFSAAINEHGRKLSDKIEEAKLPENDYLTVDPETGKQFNAKAATYFASTAAQGLGLSSAGMSDPKQLAAKSRQQRKEYEATLPGTMRDLPVIDTALAVKYAAKTALTPGASGHAKLDAEIKKLTEERDEAEYLENIVQAAIRTNTTGKSDPEVRKEVLDEYEKKYRVPILRQMQKEAPLITWNAANDPVHTGDERIARNARLKELYERVREKEELSYSDSKDFYLDEKQKKRSTEAAIGDKATIFTPTFDEAKQSKTARSLAGLHQAISSLIEETEKEINETKDPIIQGNAARKLQEYKQRENDIRIALKSIPRKDRSFKKP